jgi:hypothetical protein
VKDFVGQLHGVDLPGTPWEINADNRSEFMQELWGKAKPHLCRGVNISSNSTGELDCAWMDEYPVIENICLYVQPVNIVGHRAIEWSSNMDNARLRALSGKNMKLYIYKYSSNVNSKTSFTKVQKILLNPPETDRSGAASISLNNAMKDKLRSIHEDHYEATDLSWGIWSNFILQKPADRHEDLIGMGPPVDLISLFTPRSIPAQITLSNLRQTNQIGIDMVDTLLQEIPHVKRCIEDAVKRVDSLERILQIYQRQFAATAQATHASGVNIVESRHSVEILQITDFESRGL